MSDISLCRGHRYGAGPDPEHGFVGLCFRHVVEKSAGTMGVNVSNVFRSDSCTLHGEVHAFREPKPVFLRSGGMKCVVRHSPTAQNRKYGCLPFACPAQPLKNQHGCSLPEVQPI